MKKIGVWLIPWLLSLAPVSAQVTVEIFQEQSYFLPGEAIKLAVRITNRSGQTLRLGAEPDWLTFTVESREGSVVSQTGDVPVTGAFELESSKMATKRVDLAPYYSFPRVGRYLATAVVKIKSWDREVTSEPKAFTVIEGAKLWQQEFGLPQAAKTNSEPEIRKYILQQATYVRGPLRLYLRVTDAAGSKTFKVVPIGPMVSFGRPEPQIDPESNLHLLYQNGPYSFSYTVHSPEGELLKREAYDMSDRKPRLRLGEDGKIAVSGGVRRDSPNDIPPPKTEEEGKTPAGEAATNKVDAAAEPK